MSFGKCDKPRVEIEEDEDEDSDDEWFSPHASRGYQRVKTGADWAVAITFLFKMVLRIAHACY